MDWNLADAKDHLSEVVLRAPSEGLQRVRRRLDAVDILATEEYERLAGRARRSTSLVQGRPRPRQVVRGALPVPRPQPGPGRDL